MDVGGEDVDARRSADQARHLVGRHAHDEQQQQRGKDRRPQQRQGYFAEHVGVVAACHHRRLFHAHVEHAQRRPEREIGERKVVTRQRPDHPRHGIDVYGRRIESQQRFEHRIGPADIRAEHEDPRHRDQQSRNREREDRQGVKQARTRRVGALDRPGNERAHDKGGERGADREHHGIAEQAEDVPAGICFDEVIERQAAGAEPGVFREGVVKQRRERNEDKPGGEHDAEDEQ